MRRHYRVTHQPPGLDHSASGDSEEHGSLQWEKVEVAEGSPEVEAVLEWREARKFINYFVRGNNVPSGSDLTLDGPGSITDATDDADKSTSEEGDALAVRLFYPYASTEARPQTVLDRQGAVSVAFIFTFKLRVFPCLFLCDRCPRPDSLLCSTYTQIISQIVHPSSSTHDYSRFFCVFTESACENCLIYLYCIVFV
jgi:hypothetical protein